jgi:hypothetical protein
MSLGFEEMLLRDKSTTRVIAPMLKDLCLPQKALTWYLALPSS